MNHDLELFEELVGKPCDELAQKIENKDSLLLAARTLRDIAEKSEWKLQKESIYAAVGRILISYDKRCVKEEAL